MEYPDEDIERRIDRAEAAAELSWQRWLAWCDERRKDPYRLEAFEAWLATR